MIPLIPFLSPLNEGRGRDPGDTGAYPRRRPPGSPLNEGRGRDPGDTPDALCAGGCLGARSTKAGAETPATPPTSFRARVSLRRSTKAGAETPATLLIGSEHLHGRNSVPDLPTHDSDFDHLFGLCLGMDVVTDPQMSSKSATNHNFEPSGA